MPSSLSSQWRQLISIAKWIPQAKTIDTLDSPVLIEFVKQVFHADKTNSPEREQIEAIRRGLIHDQSIIENINYGQGSVAKCTERSIAQIAKTAVSNQRKCELLCQLTKYYQPASILELGTCLGISTYYMALASPTAKIITIEGHPDLHRQAMVNAPQWMSDTSFILGEFKIVLNQLISEGRKFDLLYVDGDHSSVAQEELWPLYQALSHEKTIYILDDIYWSKDMTTWWSQKKKSEQFNVAIDLYYFGILQCQSSVKESLDVKIFPRKGRWQLGIRR